MSSLQIRPATESDVPLLLELITALSEYERLRHEMAATEEQLRKTLFGDRKCAEAIIADWEGEPAGFALFFHNYSTFLAKPGLYLEDLFVRPELRGLGIGKALLKRLAQVAVERDCGRFEWWVLDWNEPAIRFYESLGARPMSDWTVFRVDGENLRALADDAKEARL